MNSTSIDAPAIDVSVVVADALVDSGLFDQLLIGLGKAIKGVPKAVVRWIGPELRTPDNSAPPNLSFSGGELVNGVVFVEASSPSYWVLVKAGAHQRGHGHDPFPESGPHHGAPHGWPPAPHSTQQSRQSMYENAWPAWEDELRFR